MREVSDSDLQFCLAKLRDLRAAVVKRNIDPRALRQAMVQVLEIDTYHALKSGVPPKDLEAFDEKVRADMREWIKHIERRRT